MIKGKIILGLVLVVALTVPMIACSGSDEPTATTTAFQTTSATTSKTSATTTATTSKTTTSTTTATTSATTSKTSTATTTTATTSAVKKFTGLGDIPEIENKTAVNAAIQSNMGAAEFVPLFAKFTEKTGVTATHEEMLMSVNYPKENLELVSGSGAYDIILVETSTTCEWSPYLWDLYELAEKYDPQGIAGLEADIAGIHPAILRTCSDQNGNLKELPYYTYQMCQFVRQDCFDNPTEQAAFKAEFGYDLAVATTWDQTLDQANFFTRNKGEALKGVTLDKDVYGTSLMAGQFEVNDDIFNQLYGSGGAFVRVIRDASGKLTEFLITKKDKVMLAEVMTRYKAMLQYCSPGCLTGFWDFTTAQLVEGLAIFEPSAYIPLDQWAFQIEDKEPGAELTFYPCPGNQGYMGAFCNAIAKDSGNPEAAYWLTRYLSSYEAQLAAMKQGYCGIRMDIYDDPQYQSADWEKLIAARGRLLHETLDYQVQFVNDYVQFNSDAMGKIYEEQIVICHRGAIGDLTVEECVNTLTQTTLELQRKFGSLPIREET